MRIDGKVALITGASEGIGAACAAEFSRAGAKLSLCARSEEGLRRAGGGQALITAGDLTDESVRRRVVERTLERFGAIDILINNAAVGALTEGLRMELRRDGVRTMLVCPGYVLTEFQRRSVGEAPPQVVRGRR